MEEAEQARKHGHRRAVAALVKMGADLFDQSAHLPNSEERDLFNEVMVAKVLPVACWRRCASLDGSAGRWGWPDTRAGQPVGRRDQPLPQEVTFMAPRSSASSGRPAR